MQVLALVRISSNHIQPQILSSMHLGYRMPWQGPDPAATHDIANLRQAVCRLPELIRERVWKTRKLFILRFLSEVVISHVCSINADGLTWREEL